MWRPVAPGLWRVSGRAVWVLWEQSVVEQRSAAPPAWAVLAADRGYRKLFMEHVLQGEEGVDFGFLKAIEMRGRIPKG